MCNCVITQPQNTVLSLSLTGSPGLLLLVSFSFAAAQQRVWMLQCTYIMLLYLYGGLLWSLFTVPSAAGKICTRLLRNTCHGSQCRSSQIKTQSLTYFRSLLYFHTLFLLYFKHNFRVFKERCALIGRHHSTLRGTICKTSDFPDKCFVCWYSASVRWGHYLFK